MKLSRSCTILKYSYLLGNLAQCKKFSYQCKLHQDVRTQSNKKIINASELPGPPGIPILGNVLHMMLHKDFDRKRLFKVMFAMTKQYGHTFQFRMPVIGRVVLFTNPEDIKDLYIATASNPCRNGFHALKHLRYNVEGNTFHKKSGILSEDGEEWWRVRSKVQGPMLKLDIVKTYLPVMNEVSSDFLDSIPDMLDANNEAPDNFVMELYKWALESVGSVSLNTRLGCLEKDLHENSEQILLIEAVNSLFDNLFKTEIFPLWKIYKNKSYKKMAKAHDYIYRVTDKNIKLAEEELRKKKIKHDQQTLLETFLNTESLTRTDINTMILDMFIGGIDTTSHTVAFSLYELSQNKECQARLQKEIDEVLGDRNNPITASDISKLTYLKACIKETLRLYPIVTGVVRQFPKDVIINNIHIPKGWNGMFSIMGMGRDESLFTRAEVFLPQRWLKERPFDKSHPYASLPFSHGKRNCIGRRIAEQEIFVLLAKIFHRYNVSYHYGKMECDLHLVLTPSNPLKFQFTLRK